MQEFWHERKGKRWVTILKLSIMSPCVWSLVWPYNPCFIPNLIADNCEQNWVWLMKPCILFTTFAGFYTDKTWFNEWRTWVGVKLQVRQIKNWGETPVWNNLGEKIHLIHSFFFSCALLSSWLLISSPDLSKLGPSTPSLGYFTTNHSV
jgi:hypothetical protein